MSYIKDLYWAMQKNVVPSLEGEYEEPTIHALRMKGLLQAIKFDLPKNGQLFEDEQYKGLDKDEPLHLPYSQVALEFPVSIKITISPNIPATLTKCVILLDDILCHTTKLARDGDPSCEELLSGREDVKKDPPILIAGWFYCPQKHTWLMCANFALSSEHWTNGRDADGYFDFCVSHTTDFKKGSEGLYEGGTNTVLLAVASFLSAMACSNVTAHARKAPNKNGKPPLPFDDYKVLVVNHKLNQPTGKGASSGGTGRHPREHLRRGHIRRLTHLDGRRIWINAAVVNAGAPGKVHKRYKLEPA